MRWKVNGIRTIRKQVAALPSDIKFYWTNWKTIAIYDGVLNRKFKSTKEEDFASTVGATLWTGGDHVEINRYLSKLREQPTHLKIILGFRFQHHLQCIINPEHNRSGGPP